MGNAVFIVWRETLEAVLIVSILYSFLIRQKQTEAAQKGRRFLWLGVGAGIALSLVLAALIIRVQEGLVGRALDYFQTLILFISAALMTQMVFWMSKHGRVMKKSLESELSEALQDRGMWSVAAVAGLAVAREGAETVVYFYGIAFETGMGSKPGMLLAALIGLGLALLSAWIISKGIRFLNYQTFFKVTGILLLLSAAGLISAGTNKLIELEVLPSLINPLWDTSVLLDSSTRPGGLLASFTGYRSKPSAMLVIVYSGFWIFSSLSMLRMKRSHHFKPAAQVFA